MEEADRSFVYAVARRIVRDDAEAEDVAQEALLLAHRHRDQYRGQASYRTWLHRIATTAALTALRRRRAARRRIDALADHIQISADTGTPPDLLLERARAAAQLERAVGALDEKYACVLALRLRDESEREIAETLGVTVATVKIRAFRGRNQLARLLAQDANALTEAGAPSSSTTS